ncbi:MAG: ATP-dependent DNA ligase [Thermoproteota archaeon]
MSPDEDKSETEFLKCAELCELLSKTKKRNEKVRMIADFLRSLRLDEVSPAVLLITGYIFPESEEKTLNIGFRSLSKISEMSGQVSLFNKPLTILQVRDYFERIAKTSGKGSREVKERLLSTLLNNASPLEAKYIVKNIFGEMQTGVAEGGLMLEAIAKLSGSSIEDVRRASMFLGNLGEVAEVALNRGREGLRRLEVVLFKPVKPMLGEMAYSVEEVFQNLEGKVAFEYKFDGARVQIHKRGEDVRIFTRRLSEVTRSLLEIVGQVKDELRAESAILDGEVIALDSSGRPLPFQDLMRRFKRKREVEVLMEKIPLKLFIFDILYHNGRGLIDLPYSERWNILSASKGDLQIAPRIVTSDSSEARSFLEKAIQEGHEGLMAKALDSRYSPGSRGKKWFKIKYAENLDLVILGADWGYGKRTGWLSDYYLAAYDPKEGRFELVGKTFKGLTDEEFKAITKRLLDLRISENEHTVWVRPSIVVEVAFSEVQRSPHYKSGFALRFARIVRIRDDKSPKDADTIERVRQIYERQFAYKGKIVDADLYFK